jgi:integrase
VQVYAIADGIEKRYRALVLLATFASLRWGELIALRKTDIDLDALTVTVDKAYSEDRGKFILGPPKSDAGKRVVPFPEVIAPDLDSHLRWFAEKGKNGRVFVGHKGATPRRTNLQKYWRAALVEAKVDQPLHLHDLRHTGNTLSAQTGASLRELMARAGHSSSQAALGLPARGGGAQPCDR